MKKRKLAIVLVIILSLAFTGINYTETVAAATNHNTVKNKVAGYIYKGILKIKEGKYGIEITNKDGTKKYYVFDKKGQKLAKALVTSSKVKEGTAVSVNGIIKNNAVQVISISEIAAKEQTYTGWLGDSDCSPNLEDPAQMGIGCLKHTECEASGYGISVKQKDGTYKYYKFDAEGHKLVKENIIPKVTTKKVPEITVIGTLDGDILKVSSISLK